MAKTATGAMIVPTEMRLRRIPQFNSVFIISQRSTEGTQTNVCPRSASVQKPTRRRYSFIDGSLNPGGGRFTGYPPKGVAGVLSSTSPAAFKISR